jgi:hypothetical protein
MSWWETGKERLVIGDVPADKVTGGLKSMAAARRQSGQAEPTLPQLLSGLGRVLGQDKLVAKTSRGTVVGTGPNGPELDAGLREIVRAVDEAYQDELKRAPKIEEVLANFLFVLGFEPERYLSKLDGATIEDIAAEPN